jgi:hypothetical protein
MTLPTVAEYFGRFSDKGHIPRKAMPVLLRDGHKAKIVMIFPSHDSVGAPVKFRLHGGVFRWDIEGGYYNRKGMAHNLDIISVLDDEGANLIAETL